ncbi:ATP synthase subunit a [Planctomycetales bacterium 10988]|nr:ATP synthase subunit a [Planctomycetales bacterium 10988]
MADDPLFHLQDSYYFEVPKILLPGDRFKSMEDVPSWLREPEWLTDDHIQELPNQEAAIADKEALEHATLEDWQDALAGKALIPQPFGTPLNLYEPWQGFCISKFMILELVAGLLILVVFAGLARHIRGGNPPRGRFWNLIEESLFFVRDQIAKPALGEKDMNKHLPFLWSSFFFILLLNLFGLIPFTGTATGEFGVTLALALVAFIVTISSGIESLGPGEFWLNMVPKVELPWYLFPLEVVIKFLIFLIEVIGLVIRHAVLAIRLLANMVAGHLVILAILGLVVGAAEAGVYTWGITTVIGVLGTTAFYVLELLVAVLQAFVFTFLAALFIGQASHHH